MTNHDKWELIKQYSSTFGNLNEVCVPAIEFRDEFIALVQQALERGQPLTQAEVDAAIPGIAWNW